MMDPAAFTFVASSLKAQERAVTDPVRDRREVAAKGLPPQLWCRADLLTQNHLIRVQWDVWHRVERAVLKIVVKQFCRVLTLVPRRVRSRVVDIQREGLT